jgi:hypothetical protein
MVETAACSVALREDFEGKTLSVASTIQPPLITLAILAKKQKTTISSGFLPDFH